MKTNFLDISKSKYFSFLLIFILNVIFVLIRLFDINRPLWNDELISLETLKINPLENPLYNGVSTNLPLFYYVIKLFSFFTTNDQNLRFVSLIFGLGILNIILYKYLKEKSLLYLILSLFLIFSPIQIYYSQELRTYMLTQLLLLILFFETKKILNSEKINYFLFSLTIFLALISHYTSFIFVGSLFAYLLFAKKINQKVLKSFIISSLVATIIFISISGNSGFSDSTNNSILNLNFERLTFYHFIENIKKSIEVITIYYNFGLHYYRIDGFFASLFKKFMYLILMLGAFFLIKKNADEKDFKFSTTLLVTLIFFSIVFDMLGFVPFGGRYLFPFNFIYLFFLAKIFDLTFKLNKFLFLILFLILLGSYQLYNTCLIRNLSVYTGNNDPQGILIQRCFE